MLKRSLDITTIKAKRRVLFNLRYNLMLNNELKQAQT